MWFRALVDSLPESLWPYILVLAPRQKATPRVILGSFRPIRWNSTASAATYSASIVLAIQEEGSLLVHFLRSSSSASSRNLPSLSSSKNRLADNSQLNPCSSKTLWVGSWHYQFAIPDNVASLGARPAMTNRNSPISKSVPDIQARHISSPIQIIAKP